MRATRLRKRIRKLERWIFPKDQNGITREDLMFMFFLYTPLAFWKKWGNVYRPGADPRYFESRAADMLRRGRTRFRLIPAFQQYFGKKYLEITEAHIGVDKSNAYLQSLPPTSPNGDLKVKSDPNRVAGGDALLPSRRDATP